MSSNVSPVAAEHDRHAANQRVALAILAPRYLHLVAPDELNVRTNFRRICQVSQPAFLGGEIVGDIVGVLHFWLPNRDVQKPVITVRSQKSRP